MQNGLASQGVQASTQDNNFNEPEYDKKLKQVVMQVVELLKQGMSPEDLVQQGVPKEIVDMALKIMQQEEANTDSGMVAEQPQGLAAMNNV